MNRYLIVAVDEHMKITKVIDEQPWIGFGADRARRELKKNPSYFDVLIIEV